VSLPSKQERTLKNGRGESFSQEDGECFGSSSFMDDMENHSTMDSITRGKERSEHYLDTKGEDQGNICAKASFKIKRPTHILRTD
jgi:hypothetical protein